MSKQLSFSSYVRGVPLRADQDSESLSSQKKALKKNTSSQKSFLESEIKEASFLDKDAYSVSQLNSLIKGSIESQFQDVYVKGEVSNFCAHSSRAFLFSSQR